METNCNDTMFWNTTTPTDDQSTFHARLLDTFHDDSFDSNLHRFHTYHPDSDDTENSVSSLTRAHRPTTATRSVTGVYGVHEGETEEERAMHESTDESRYATPVSRSSSLAQLAHQEQQMVQLDMQRLRGAGKTGMGIRTFSSRQVSVGRDGVVMVDGGGRGGGRQGGFLETPVSATRMLDTAHQMTLRRSRRLTPAEPRHE
jgi:hypothetical protein